LISIVTTIVNARRRSPAACGVELRDTTPQVIPERVAKALLARSPADTGGPPTARPPG
jgi:hypothetical protein